MKTVAYIGDVEMQVDLSSQVPAGPSPQLLASANESERK